MIEYEKTTYYTLEEAITGLQHEWPPYSGVSAPELADTLQGIIDDRGDDYYETLSFIREVDSHAVIEPAAVALLNAMLQRYGDHIAVITRKWLAFGEAYGAEGHDFYVACMSFADNVISLLNLTYPRYSVVLAAYEAQKAKLLDAVEVGSSALTRHNDAPQNSGDYSGDDYASDYTYVEGTQEIDHGTPIERLHEIETRYNNVIKDWLREFSGLFILEENVI